MTSPETSLPAATFDRPMAGLDRSYVLALLVALDDAVERREGPYDCSTDGCRPGALCPPHWSDQTLAAGYRRMKDKLREGLRHPQVTYWNAITTERLAVCYPDPATAFDGATTRHPYNNTRVTFGYCSQVHEDGLASA